MATPHDPTVLPGGLPVPQDDGATRHLAGRKLPAIALAATHGPPIDLSTLRGRTVVYVYPRTGRPGENSPDGWDAIPGARGCTPQSCSFRDHFDELKRLGVAHVFGLSTQDTDYQREAAERLHLPFAVLSDEGLALTRALDLPTFSNRRHDVAQAHGLDHRRWRDRQGVLSGVSARQECGRGHRLAQVRLKSWKGPLMVKLIVLYGHPTDPAAFEKYYTDVHMPIAAQIEGVQIELAKVKEAPDGSTLAVLPGRPGRLRQYRPHADGADNTGGEKDRSGPGQLRDRRGDHAGRRGGVAASLRQHAKRSSAVSR